MTVRLSQIGISPQESHDERKKRLNPGTSQRRNLSPRQRFHKVPTTFKPPCRRGWSPDDDEWGHMLARDLWFFVLLAL